MTTFISYATPWDMHKGTVSIGNLPVNTQNELIRLILDPDGDERQFAIDNAIIKDQVDGLWSIIIYIGGELERHHLISSFESRSQEDIEKIIDFIDETKLGSRLNFTYNSDGPSNDAPFYDWTELESVKIEKLTTVMDTTLSKIQTHLYKFISPIFDEIKQERDDFDLSPIKPSLIEKFIDTFYLIFDKKKYNFRLAERKIEPYRIKYVLSVEQEIKLALGNDTYPMFLHAQASDINFLKSTYLLYDTGFIYRVPLHSLVAHIVHALYIYSTKSKPEGVLSLLTAIDILKSQNNNLSNSA